MKKIFLTLALATITCVANYGMLYASDKTPGEKVDDFIDKTKDEYEKAKDKAGDQYDKAKDKANETKHKIKRKYHAIKDAAKK